MQILVGGGFVVNILILKESSYFFALSNFLYIIAGVVFGVVTSLAGGMYPAWKAANMRPLDALRYEWEVVGLQQNLLNP